MDCKFCGNETISAFSAFCSSHCESCFKSNNPNLYSDIMKPFSDQNYLEEISEIAHQKTLKLNACKKTLLDSVFREVKSRRRMMLALYIINIGLLIISILVDVKFGLLFGTLFGNLLCYFTIRYRHSIYSINYLALIPCFFLFFAYPLFLYIVGRKRESYLRSKLFFDNDSLIEFLEVEGASSLSDVTFRFRTSLRIKKLYNKFLEAQSELSYHTFQKLDKIEPEEVNYEERKNYVDNLISRLRRDYSGVYQPQECRWCGTTFSSRTFYSYCSRKCEYEENSSR